MHQEEENTKSANKTMQQKREFDIALYCDDTTHPSFIRAFETLSLKVIVIFSEQDEKITMLPFVICSFENINIETEKVQTFINLSAYTLETIVPLIDACINTHTNYIDRCSDITIAKHVFSLYNEACQAAGVKIIQACQLEPFLIDLGMHAVGMLHDINAVDCTMSLESCGFIKPPQSLLQSDKELLFIDYLVKKSHRHFRKHGISHIKKSTIMVKIDTGKQSLYTIMQQFLMFSPFLKRLVQKTKVIESKQEFEIVFSGSHLKSEKKSKLIISGVEKYFSASATCLLAAAISLCEVGFSGVITPAIAFYRTDLIERLNSGNIKFEFFL
ncbi:hypothetical protein GINT2_000688 [Glugoides intestinalis]